MVVRRIVQLCADGVGTSRIAKLLNADGARTPRAQQGWPNAWAPSSIHGLYPYHDWTAVITTCGLICYQRRTINVSQVFAGKSVGVKQVDDHLWLVTFMHYDLGYFDDETGRLEPIGNPVDPTLSPMSPE